MRMQATFGRQPTTLVRTPPAGPNFRYIGSGKGDQAVYFAGDTLYLQQSSHSTPVKLATLQNGQTVVKASRRCDGAISLVISELEGYRIFTVKESLLISDLVPLNIS